MEHQTHNPTEPLPPAAADVAIEDAPAAEKVTNAQAKGLLGGVQDGTIVKRLPAVQCTNKATFVTRADETEDMFILLKASSKELWKKHYVELAPSHPKSSTATHKCIAFLANGSICGDFVKLQFTVPKQDMKKRNYKRSKAVQHLRIAKHRGTAAGDEMGTDKHDQILAIGRISRWAPSSPKIGTPEQVKLAQIGWYICSSGFHSKSTFEDPYFIAMIHAVHGDAAIVPRKSLFEFVLAEFMVLKRYAQFVFAQLYHRHGGNAFASLVHDDVTLNDKLKRTAAGSQFMFEATNFYLAFMFRPVAGGDGKSHARQLDEVYRDFFSMSRTTTVYSVMSDVAALNVAAEMKSGGGSCNMHVGDKVARIATGRLDRMNKAIEGSRKKAAGDPFPACVELTAKNRKVAKHHSWYTRRNQLHPFFALSNTPVYYPRVDISSTRMMSELDMLNRNVVSQSALRLMISTKSVQKSKDAKVVAELEMSIQEWKATGEIEAVLQWIAAYIGNTQYEGVFAAYKHYLVRALKAKLAVGTGFDVVDVGSITSESKASDPVRVNTSDGDATEIGVKVKARALEDMGVRFSDEITNKELAVIKLDLRGTSLCLKDDEDARGRKQLKEDYVTFAQAHAEYTHGTNRAVGKTLRHLVKVKQENKEGKEAPPSPPSPRSNQEHEEQVQQQQQQEVAAPTFGYLNASSLLDGGASGGDGEVEVFSTVA